MKKEFRLSLNLDGLISIRFPHFQSEIQRTDWLQKVKLTQHANFAVPKVRKFSGKLFAASQCAEFQTENC